MSKNRGTSTNRKVRRGKVAFIYNETLKRIFKYVLTDRGSWMLENNPSALRLSKHQLLKLKQQ